MGFELIGATSWESTLDMVLLIAKVAIGLGFVIFVHELGHFLVAKMCGVKCEKFYIGFDIPMPFGIPSRFYRFQWGETEYGIGVLPLGGYVKMLGQDDNPMRAEEEAERTRIHARVTETSRVTETTRDDSDGPAAPANTNTNTKTKNPFRDSASTPAPVAAKLSAATTAGAPHASSSYELDPRSYTAKAVWQRMLIISAGVVMNLIFAVIFAAFAYRAGVPFMPCEIGQVVPGGPAWKAGLEPGSRIVQIGEGGQKREKLRFDFDLKQSVYTHGDQSDLALLLRNAQGNEEWKHVRPYTIREGWESMTSIGIVNASSLKLHPAMPAQEGSAAAQAGLTSRDRVLGVDGQPVENGFQLRKYLARYPERTVTLQVERSMPDDAPPQIVEVAIPPQKLRDLGLIMDSGPISAVRPESAAAKAGLKSGDRIVAVNAVPLADPMLLPEVLRPYFDQEVAITVERPGESLPITMPVRLNSPTSYEWMQTLGGSMASDALGVAYEVGHQVRAVVPGSPAASVGFKPDDVITGFKLSWKDAKTKENARRAHGKSVKVDDHQYTWPYCFYVMQSMVPGEVLELTYERAGKQLAAELAPVEIDAFNPDRGLVFDSISEIHQVNSWGEAIALGCRQTWEEAFKVAAILKKLVTGRVSVANLGGIGSIAYVAGNEASQGTTRLLIFLTMLSANLAVLNFLPIPALDGGHMMFLIYEGIFRKPVNERLQYVLTIAGVACLLGLMIFVNAMDLHRFLSF